MTVTYLPGRAPLPSREHPVKMAQIGLWMQEKAEADRARCPGLTPDLWCIRGELYDLTGFINSHPGGEMWIRDTKGMDVTEWFETHHVDIAKAERYMAKYKVGECKDFQPIFTFKQDGFYATLRRRVHESGSGVSGPAFSTQAVSVACLLGWAASFIAMTRKRNTAGEMGSYKLAVPCGMLLYTMFGLGHNFFHMRDTIFRFMFDLTTFSSHRWRFSHALGHHPYVNLEIDPEAYTLESVLSYLRSRPTNNWSVWPRWPIFNFLLGPLEAIVPLVQASTTDPLLPRDAIPFIEAAVAAKLCGSVKRGIGLVAVMHGVMTSILIALSTPVHRSDESWTEGCGDPVMDFGEHIVKTTQEYNVDCPPVMRMALGFNDHIIHHLFPTIDVANQHRVRKLLDEELKAHKVPMRKVSFWRLLWGTARVLLRPGNQLMYNAPDPM
mmetsp:Transcript_12759/g.30537  ORF Transcript_12759/g.30537 Transcript_12759/m.30537 type:complete len:438 (-) Transcript_12759:149-1462(-)